jgi:hypothetical protein
MWDVGTWFRCFGQEASTVLSFFVGSSGVIGAPLAGQGCQGGNAGLVLQGRLGMRAQEGCNVCVCVCIIGGTYCGGAECLRAIGGMRIERAQNVCVQGW